MSELKFPLFIDLGGKKVRVFGGGAVAQRRVETLLLFGAEINLVAPEISAALKALGGEGRISLEQRAYEKGELKDEFMVIAATSDSGVNAAISGEAKSKGMYFNCASDKTLSGFFFPGVCVTEDISVGVCGTGKDHKNVKKVSQAIRNTLQDLENG